MELKFHDISKTKAKCGFVFHGMREEKQNRGSLRKKCTTIIEEEKESVEFVSLK